ncbi:hypothetical protein ACIRVF_32635 [Kitasatospora sp. NPDC101157]|uniref:hypothetical protein n=1 Tax=Kitasatospora sp. NPDC101157 TaxID=3364098 RepID=UPI003816082D
MDRIVDLDGAAAEVAARAPGWRAAGLVVGELTWRDAAAPWPQGLETDRARVGDPDSMGVLVSGPRETVLSVVLFRGGWADVDYLGDEDAGALAASGIDSAAVFGLRLAAWVVRVFGERAGRRSRG